MITRYIFCFMYFVFLSSVWAQEKGNNVAITFFPVFEKAEKLVAVELVTSVPYQKRYLALERSVMQNDWRPLLPGSDGVNPGKCTVYTVERGFLIECWLSSSHKERMYASKALVQSIEEVITTVVNFSKNR